MNKIFRAVLIIAIVAVFGFLGERVCKIFKVEKVIPVIEEEITVEKEIAAVVTGFEDTKNSILIKREDNLECISLNITDSTIIINEKGLILSKNDIKLGNEIKIEFVEDKSKYVAKKIYL